MNKKISQLDVTTGLTESAYIPLVQGLPVKNYIISTEDLRREIGSNITSEYIEGKLSYKENKPISLSYSELYDLTQTSGLTVGQRYIINDYQTIYTQPVSNELLYGPTEPLMVEALTVNKLKNECYSTLFPQDIVYYDIENNQSMVPGCTKGYIYRRVDTLRNNDIGFDYRNVKFRRWQLNVTLESVDGNEVFTKNSVVKKTDSDEVYIKLSDEQVTFDEINKWKRYDFDNLMYVIPQDDDWAINGAIFPNSGLYFDYHMFSTEPTIEGVECIYDAINYNKIKVNSADIIANSNSVFFGDNFKSNTIGSDFRHNTIGNDFHYNTIENGFYYNTIGSGFFKNVIGSSFYSNNIGYDFQYNNVGNDFQSNLICEDFSHNTIGNIFQSNAIGSVFSENIIANYFQNNVSIGSNFSRNRIGDYFMNNTTISGGFRNNNIADNFQYNSDIGGGFSDNRIGNYFQYNSDIGGGFSDNRIGNYFQYNVHIGTGFGRNNIGSEFRGNNIANNFTSNTIQNNFFSNTIGIVFTKNKVGNDFYVNNIGPAFQSNTIDDYFNQNTIEVYFHNNIIGRDFYGNNIGGNFTNNVTASSFQSNTIENNFQNNTIESSIKYVDFTSAYYVYQMYPTKIYLTNNDLKLLSFIDEFGVENIVPANSEEIIE